MFPIYICWDSKVRPAEQNAIMAGMRETKAMFGCEVVYYGTDAWQFGRYKNADEIMRTAPHNCAGQANAGNILTMMASTMNTWIEPGAMVLFTGEDLYIDGTNWCFGAARIKARVSVQSVARYRILDKATLSACVRRTLRHELGHIFTCAHDLMRSHTEMNLGEHCTNPRCSMRQTLNLAELLRAVREENAQNCFCAQCLADLNRFKMKYEASEGRVADARGRRRERVVASAAKKRKR